MSLDGEHRIFLERPLRQVRLLTIRERANVSPANARRSTPINDSIAKSTAPASDVKSPDSKASTIPDAVPRNPGLDEAKIAEALEQNESLRLLEELLLSLQEQLNELENRRKASLSELQRVAVELAVAVAGHILRTEVLAGNYPLESLVREAIDRLGGPPMATVNVHPEDLAWLQSHGDITTKFATIARWNGDRGLQRGSCFVEAGDLGLVANWSQQLEDIHRRLLEGLEDAQIERRGSRETPEGMRRFPERRETA